MSYTSTTAAANGTAPISIGEDTDLLVALLFFPSFTVALWINIYFVTSAEIPWARYEIAFRNAIVSEVVLRTSMMYTLILRQ